jgi:hypothetical protein
LDEPISNQSLSGAVDNLKLAAEGYIKGDFSSIILNIRNALANNLTEIVDASPSEKKRMLKNVIKEKCSRIFFRIIMIIMKKY